MKLNRPLRFQMCPPRQLEPKGFSYPFTRPILPVTPPTAPLLTLAEFKRLFAQYKGAGFALSYIWHRGQERSIFNQKIAMPIVLHPIIEPFTSEEWKVNEWSIKFMLSERLLTHARKRAGTSNWYEDPQISANWSSIIAKCFRSVQAYYKSFAILPMVGDRLFDEDTGWQIQDRSIDGDLMTITFTLDS
ncbi:MAG: hypothetical protein EOO88_57135 [Pedobacter sp.]|nr:MAG: hypothetical protein EOO88_57135 [Pedobacter sp.]